jgi:hypothetical protein
MLQKIRGNPAPVWAADPRLKIEKTIAGIRKNR